MKKEITVYVSDNCISNYRDKGFISNRMSTDFDNMFCHKATLTIDIPEKKYEITEAEFDEAWEKGKNGIAIDRQVIKEELFKR